jgi:hypothetical protein
MIKRLAAALAVAADEVATRRKRRAWAARGTARRMQSAAGKGGYPMSNAVAKSLLVLAALISIAGLALHPTLPPDADADFGAPPAVQSQDAETREEGSPGRATRTSDPPAAPIVLTRNLRLKDRQTFFSATGWKSSGDGRWSAAV